MMLDKLTDRLLVYADNCKADGIHQAEADLRAAAARIEALEAEVASLREANQTWADMFGPSAALAEEQDK